MPYKKQGPIYTLIMSFKLTPEQYDSLHATKDYWGLKSASQVLRQLIDNHCLKKEKQGEENG